MWVSWYQLLNSLYISLGSESESKVFLSRHCVKGPLPIWSPVLVFLLLPLQFFNGNHCFLPSLFHLFSTQCPPSQNRELLQLSTVWLCDHVHEHSLITVHHDTLVDDEQEWIQICATCIMICIYQPFTHLFPYNFLHLSLDTQLWFVKLREMVQYLSTILCLNSSLYKILILLWLHWECLGVDGSVLF